MSDPSVTIKERLLEAHVQHELNALTGERFLGELQTEVDAVFGLLERRTLRDLVSAEQIYGVIQRRVVELDIHPGIPELAGEMAARVRAAAAQNETPLKQILSRRQVAEFVDAALGLSQQRERLIAHVLEHPLYQDLVAELVYQGIVNYFYEENALSKNVPGIAATMKLGRRMLGKAASGLDASLEKNLKAYINRTLPFLIRQSHAFINGALTDEELKDSAMEVWDMLEDKTLADLQTGLGELELQEFVVLGYEFWQKFRKTPYFKSCYTTVVDYLFEKYGDEPLQTLVGDMGVNAAMVKTELEAFAPALLEALEKTGYLEEMLRRRLASFYHSEAAVALLAQNDPGSQPQSPSKPESTLQSKPQSKPRAKQKPQSKPEPQPKRKPQPGPAPKPKATSQPKPKPKPKQT